MTHNFLVVKGKAAVVGLCVDNGQGVIMITSFAVASFAQENRGKDVIVQTVISKQQQEGFVFERGKRGKLCVILVVSYCVIDPWEAIR
jgi:glycosyltransferase A (GT-A) superfamily protein (DUF2064 family)